LRRTCQPAETASGVSNNTDSWQQPPKAQPKQVGPIISLLAKELQAQWHEERNMHLGGDVIKPYSNRKVWWSCDQCPDSLPHVWEAIVYSRSLGAGCPYCSGQEVCQHNSLGQKGTTGCTTLGCQQEPSAISRPSDCLQPEESALEMQCLLKRVAGSSDVEGILPHWVPQVCEGKWQYESRRN